MPSTTSTAPLATLRTAIVEALYPTSANILPDVCEGLGLAPGTRNEAMSSKRTYVMSRLNKLSPEDTVRIARRILVEQGGDYRLEEAADRFAEASSRVASDLVRRHIGRALNQFDLCGELDVLDLIREHFPIDLRPGKYGVMTTMAEDLQRHFIRNCDMDNEEVLDAVGAYDCSQRRFFAFLEAIVHPRTRGEAEQQAIVDALNPILGRDGFALIQKSKVSGYPVFTVQEVGTAYEAPADAVISEALAAFDEASVHAAWTKALERRATHPEGAITSARTLLETVCKHIIEDAGGTYGEKDELPKLYRTAAEHLNLAPDQHTEEVFKAILGNCQSVVNSLASIRNKLSDAHGRGRRAARPLPRHAELAVNLAGTMATFLVSTWRARQDAKP
ncbi:abortive infection family protein [Azospirillum argentinense]|uniref:abortive infection family protein n=1 Tax=Azospirillum argentinense TaxID=2970906 RepID=UPI001FFF4F8D|nr:abortive infection family protein [Azospirillum argentinense]